VIFEPTAQPNQIIASAKKARLLAVPGLRRAEQPQFVLPKKVRPTHFPKSTTSVRWQFVAGTGHIPSDMEL
jgi:hypothetical protein